MLFRRLYYYYHHYKMWSYIIGQFKRRPCRSLYDIKVEYIKKTGQSVYLNHCTCYLCSYIRLVKPSEKDMCGCCPLWRRYHETCFDKDSMFHRIYMYSPGKIPPEERIALAKKIRRCVFL